MSRDMRIATVTGDIAPADLGRTLMHEHLLCDFWHWHLELSYDGILDDQELLAEELGLFRDAGGSAIVDATSIGIGRDPVGLRRIADSTGTQVVMGAGWYRERVYPPVVFERTSEELADLIVAEFTDGVDGTGVRPGIIGEIGTDRGRVTSAQERVFRAAAMAQRVVGCSITTHTTYFGDLALEQVAMLSGEGVPPERIVIGHLGEERRLERTLEVAKTGVFVEIDHVGATQVGQFAPEPQRLRNVLALIEAGHADQLLLSMDVCKRSQLHAYGGNGYDYLNRRFVPLLLEAGVSPSTIQTILVDNPRRVLAF